MLKNPALDSVIPSLDMRALARRAALPAALAAVAAAVVILAGGPLQAFADAVGRVADADPRWLVAGAAFEFLSFGGYIALLWLVGGRATPRLGFRASAEVTLGGAAATRLLPTGGVAGAALTIWAFRRAGLDARDATRTLLAFLVLLYSIFLGAIALAGGLLALGILPGHGPLALTALPAAAAVLAILSGLALALLRPHGALGAAVRQAIALVRSADLRLLGAPAWWAFDAAVLWAMLQALGAPPSLAVVVLAYFVGQVANTIPRPRRGERRHGRRAAGLRGRGRSGARLGARLPLGGHLAARPDRAGRAGRPASDPRPVGLAGLHAGLHRHTHPP